MVEAMRVANTDAYLTHTLVIVSLDFPSASFKNNHRRGQTDKHTRAFLHGILSLHVCRVKALDRGGGCQKALSHELLL